MSTIIKTDFEFTREKLKGAFGFKGRYLTELWQTAALIRTENHTAVAPATQSVLWSDGAVFGENPPAAANLLMASVTAHALRLLEGRLLERPDLMLDSLIPRFTNMPARYAAEPLRPPLCSTRWWAWISRCGHFTRAKTGWSALTISSRRMRARP